MEETDSSSSEDNLPLAQYSQQIVKEHSCLELSDQEQSEQQIKKVVEPIAHKEEDLRGVENVSKVEGIAQQTTSANDLNVILMQLVQQMRESSEKSEMLNQQMKESSEKLSQKIDENSQKIDERFDENSQKIDERFDKTSQELQKTSQELQEIKIKVNESNENNQKLNIKFDEKFKNVNEQFNRLEQELQSKFQEVQNDFDTKLQKVQQQTKSDQMQVRDELQTLREDCSKSEKQTNEQIKELKDAKENLKFRQDSLNSKVKTTQESCEKNKNEILEQVQNLKERFATVEKEQQIYSDNLKFQNDLFDGHTVPDVYIKEIVDHQLDKFKDNLTETVDKTSQTVNQMRQQLEQAKSKYDEVVEKGTLITAGALVLPSTGIQNQLMESVPNFSGNNDRVHAVQFLKKMDRLFENSKLTEAQKIAFFNSKLVGDAEAWLNNHEAEYTSYEAIKIPFRKRFWSVYKQDKLVNDIFTGRYDPHRGPMCDYYNRYAMQAGNLDIPIDEERLVNQLLHHFPREIQDALIAARVKTSVEMREILEIFDERFRRERSKPHMQDSSFQNGGNHLNRESRHNQARPIQRSNQESRNRTWENFNNQGNNFNPNYTNPNQKGNYSNPNYKGDFSRPPGDRINLIQRKELGGYVSQQRNQLMDPDLEKIEPHPLKTHVIVHEEPGQNFQKNGQTSH